MTIPWYKSKQFWFNVLTVVVAICAAFGFDEFEPDPATLLIAQLGIALINVVLRFAFPSKPTPTPTARTAERIPMCDYPYMQPTSYARTNRLAALGTVLATATAVIAAAALTR